MDEVDRALTALISRSHATQEDALATLMEATGIINAAINRVTSARDYERTQGLPSRSDLHNRLRRWIGRLTKLAQEVAQLFTAASYSISVSLPGGVSVGISWQTSGDGSARLA